MLKSNACFEEKNEKNAKQNRKMQKKNMFHRLREDFSFFPGFFSRAAFCKYKNKHYYVFRILYLEKELQNRKKHKK